MSATRIAGYAAIFDAPDKGGDIIRKGAFAGGMAKAVPLYWQHDPTRRIGAVESLAEDDRGLRVIARLDGSSPSVSPGHGLSFGYRTRETRNGTYRELIGLELLEISLVSNPMQPLATVLAVENLNPNHFNPNHFNPNHFNQGEDDGL